MNITTSHTTTITLEHEKVGKVILPYEPTDPDDVIISDDGNTITYATFDPWQFDYEFPEGVDFVQGNPGYIHYCNNVQEWIDSIHETPHMNIFPVGVYEHGNIEYSLAGESMFSSDQFDYCVGAAIAIPGGPEGFTDPEGAARAILREYTDWCNGETYSIVTLTRNGDTWENDTDRGVIGYRNALEEVGAGA